MCKYIYVYMYMYASDGSPAVPLTPPPYITGGGALRFALSLV